MMMDDVDHLSLVRCVDLDENVYDLTRVVHYVVVPVPVGLPKRKANSDEYFYEGEAVQLNPDGTLEITVNGRQVRVSEISPD